MPKGLSLPKGRGPYATQACTICRAKKSKCNGVKPVCGSCAASGKDEKCSWGRDVGRKYTEAHFEALKKRADSLQTYVDRLEAMLTRCVCQNVSSHLRFRPQQPGEQSEKREESEADALDSDEEITRELAVPTQRLKLDDRSGGPLDGIEAATITGSTNAAPQVQEGVENPNASYVLQVEGIDVSQSHPEIDWSRHLPPEVILERREHDKVLDLSFKFFTMWFFRVVPSLFLRDMYRALSVPRSEEPPRTPHYSPMLHNAILSVSLAFSDEPYLRDLTTRLCFATAAKSLHELHAYTKADLSTVQAMGFLSTFYSDIGERIPAELYAGMSSRLGMTLGLGLDATPWAEAGLIEIDEIRWRNWTHWSLFCFDGTWALYLGWDLGGPSRRSTQMPFVDCDMDQNPWYHAPANIPPQPNYLTLVFFKTSALYMIARPISELVHNSAQRNAAQVEKQIAKIDLELNNWKRQLPPQLDITLENRASSTPQRLMLHLTYWWCSLTLHRPFFNYPVQRIRHSDSEVDHAKLCIHAAENILELVETWSSLYTLRLAAPALQGAIFSAGTVFLLCVLQATVSLQNERGKLQAILAQVQTCTRYLHEMGGTWPSAARTGNMLQAILNDRLQPVIVRRLAHRGMQIFAATTLDREIPPAPGMDEGNETGLPAEAAPSYVPEWDSQLDPARGWSEPPLDNLFEQIQNAPVAFGLGVQTSLASMGAAADFRTLTTVHQNV